VFHIFDAPCHGKKYHDCDDSYPKGSPDGLELEPLMEEFYRKDIAYTCVQLDKNSDKMVKIMK
jgi:hypothetical protein